MTPPHPQSPTPANGHANGNANRLEGDSPSLPDWAQPIQQTDAAGRPVLNAQQLRKLGDLLEANPELANLMRMLGNGVQAGLALPGGPTTNDSSPFSSLAFRGSTIMGLLNGGARNLEAECNYPQGGANSVPAEFYRELFDRENIPNRVVQALPAETWQVAPHVFETEDPGELTEFEAAFDELGQNLYTGSSWMQKDTGGPVWEYLYRADFLSGIGHYGIVLLGIDDGRNLQDPVEGVEVVVNTQVRDPYGMVHNVQSVLPDSPLHPAAEAYARVQVDPRPITTLFGDQKFGGKADWTKDANWEHARSSPVWWDQRVPMVNSLYNGGPPERLSGNYSELVGDEVMVYAVPRGNWQWVALKPAVNATGQPVTNAQGQPQLVVNTSIPPRKLTFNTSRQSSLPPIKIVINRHTGAVHPRSQEAVQRWMVQNAKPVEEQRDKRGRWTGGSVKHGAKITEDQMASAGFTGDAKTMAIMAGRKAEMGSGKASVLHDEHGEIAGVMSHKPQGKNLYIQYLASRKKGAGKRLLAEAAALAARKGKGLLLEGYKSARGFYDKMGLRPLGSGEGNIGYHLPREEVAAFAARHGAGQTQNYYQAGAPPGGPFLQGTDAQYAVGSGMWAGLGMAVPMGASLSGTDQQYFGVQFGPSEKMGPPPRFADDDGEIAPGVSSHRIDSGERDMGAGSDPSLGDGPALPRRPKLLFLRVFSEDLLQVVRYEWNVRNPRFGLPVMYRVTLNDPRQTNSGIGLPLATVYVHWSRVIHVADNLLSSEIFGMPRMQPVLNRLLDLRKIYAADGEGVWKSCFSGISLETNPQLGGDVGIDQNSVRAMMADYNNGLQRFLTLAGMTAKTINPQVVDVTGHVNVQLEGVAIQMAMPIRVLKGSERGELASQQDDAKWNDRLKHRQHFYVTPRIIVPFIDRMIQIGVLPVPRGKVIERDGLPTSDDPMALLAGLGDDGQGPSDWGDAGDDGDGDDGSEGGDGTLPDFDQLQGGQQQQPDQDGQQGQEEDGNEDEDGELPNFDQLQGQGDQADGHGDEDHGDTVPDTSDTDAGSGGTTQSDNVPDEVGDDWDALLARYGHQFGGGVGKDQAGTLTGYEDWTTNASRSADPPIIDLPKVRKVGRWLARHGLMPGYGEIYVRGREVWYVGGDGDEDGFGKLVRQKLERVGFDKITYEAESYPPGGEGWRLAFKPGRKDWSDYDPTINASTTPQQRDERGRWLRLDYDVVDAAADPFGQKEAQDGYLYHYTVGSALPGIAEKGLGMPRVYASKTAHPRYAEHLYENADPEERPILLRFKKTGEWRADPEAESPDYVLSDKPVPQHRMEVETPLGWKPLLRPITNASTAPQQQDRLAGQYTFPSGQSKLEAQGKGAVPLSPTGKPIPQGSTGGNFDQQSGYGGYQEAVDRTGRLSDKANDAMEDQREIGGQPGGHLYQGGKQAPYVAPITEMPTDAHGTAGDQASAHDYSAGFAGATPGSVEERRRLAAVKNAQARDEHGRFAKGDYAEVHTKNGKKVRLRILSHSDKFLHGVEVDKGGDDVVPKGKDEQGRRFTERQHLIDVTEIKKAHKLRMNNHYGELERDPTHNAQQQRIAAYGGATVMQDAQDQAARTPQQDTVRQPAGPRTPGTPADSAYQSGGLAPPSDARRVGTPKSASTQPEYEPRDYEAQSVPGSPGQGVADWGNYHNDDTLQTAQGTGNLTASKQGQKRRNQQAAGSQAPGGFTNATGAPMKRRVISNRSRALVSVSPRRKPPIRNLLRRKHGNGWLLLNAANGKPVGYQAPGGYTVEWPELDSNTGKDKAQIAQTLMGAIASYVQAQAESILPVEIFFVRIMGFEEELVREIVKQVKGQQMQQVLGAPGADGQDDGSGGEGNDQGDDGSGNGNGNGGQGGMPSFGDLQEQQGGLGDFDSLAQDQYDNGQDGGRDGEDADDEQFSPYLTMPAPGQPGHPATPEKQQAPQQPPWMQQQPPQQPPEPSSEGEYRSQQANYPNPP